MVRRLLAALLLAGLGAAVLGSLGPQPDDLVDALRSPESWVGWHGADRAVLLVASALGWAVLGWLVLGIAVTAATELPGVAGRAAGLLAHVVLPAALRQGAALTLGVGLVTAGASTAAATPASPADPGPAVSVDWPEQSAPTASPPAVPPVTPPPDREPVANDRRTGVVVVRAGDSLWAIAGDRLGPRSSDATVMAAVGEWYAANRQVIGPDPDLIHPGQRLVPPGSTS